MGEVIAHGSKQLTWDPWGRLIEVTDGDFFWQASYDALGRRLQTRDTTTTTSFYDPEEEFLEIGIQVGDQTFWKVYGPTACDAVIDATGDSAILMHNALDALAGVITSQEILYSEQLPSSYGVMRTSAPRDLVSYAHCRTPYRQFWRTLLSQ